MLNGNEAQYHAIEEPFDKMFGNTQSIFSALSTSPTVSKINTE